jgi:nucleosome binding factor SPN SPT16 subunit
VLSHDTIICSIGTKYHEYNAHIVRTYLINPEDSQKKAYQAAFDIQSYVIS